MSDDVCEILCNDEDKVNRLKKDILHQNTVEVSKIFKALSDDNRLKVAYALCVEGELCVCDVASVIGATTATASHHLRLLRNLGLAKYRKEGKLVYYSLDDAHVKELVKIAFEHQKEVGQRGKTS